MRLRINIDFPMLRRLIEVNFLCVVEENEKKRFSLSLFWCAGHWDMGDMNSFFLSFVEENEKKRFSLSLFWCAGHGDMGDMNSFFLSFVEENEKKDFRYLCF